MNRAFLHAAIAIVLSTSPTPGAEPPASYQVTDLLTASSPSASRAKEWQPGKGIALEVSGMEWIGPDGIGWERKKIGRDSRAQNSGTILNQQKKIKNYE